MRMIEIAHEEWVTVERPRRYRVEIHTANIGNRAASVTVWERHESDRGLLHLQEVEIFLLPHGVTIESSHKFDGEVRIGF